MSADLFMLGWNHCDLSRACVQSIKDCTSYPHTLFLIDNGSTDDTWAFFEGIPNAVKLHFSENRGYGAALNQVIRIGAGDYIGLVNNDVTVRPLWLSRLVDALEADPKLAAISPMTDLERQSIWEGRYFPSKPNEIYTAPPMIPFTCALLKRSVWEEIGEMDTRFFIYGEDDDWCIRARQAGYYVGVHTGVTVHHEGDATTLPAGQQWMRQRAREMLRKKHGPGHGY